ncbi:SUF system Fe-S cluster assembly regulator [Ferruginivarius sediminum]|jgi:FeS assembly SUF system regulator|uniref:SUF system Fe-S cluster assembly regulator n=1 Tax=Ferruginivarius sediminum TaxID=2661937 RepID=A0A369T8Q8_9PROT|nr:SUF system Fe-S cluster assembly regulator [Ferruginivarius sediminum]RDD60745.1 SUF system Fe-S cluster assembly regulator [Ferruginivarius sediminum]
MFRLNRLTDYAVVVMAQLSAGSKPLSSAQQIAHETGVPLPTVAKVLNVLTREGLVTSHRGAAGGYTLTRPATEIPVSDIIEALEGPIALTACVDTAGGCEVGSICPMRGTWDKVNKAIETALKGVTLHDMITSGPLPAAFADGPFGANATPASGAR